MAHPPTTPLRRVSQGSLFRLSRSSAYPDAPHGLGFLEPAMDEFVEEAEHLAANLKGLKDLSDSLETFNESFAMWLYLMDMNALTTDWPQTPRPESYELARRRLDAEERAAAELEAAAVAEAKRRAQAVAAAEADKTAATEAYNETTFATTANASKPNTLKKKKKPQMSAKEKRERGLELEKIIMSLPLEFRGGDITLRQNMELTIEGLWDAGGKSNLPSLIKPPDLNQARVNKCLIALVNRKMVRKDNSTGQVIYHWQGVP